MGISGGPGRGRGIWWSARHFNQRRRRFCDDRARACHRRAISAAGDCLVHNDATFGAIKNFRKRDYEERYLDVELNNPDFLALAAAYGVPAQRAHGPDEMRAAVSEAIGATARR